VAVTAPPSAADDPDVLAAFLAGGMDILRINCAHDGHAAWGRMVANLRAAEAAAGTPRRCLVQFDLAGPKLRTGRVPGGKAVSLKPGASVLFFSPSSESAAEAHGAVRMPVDAGAELFSHAAVGDSIRLEVSEDDVRRLQVKACGPGWLEAACEKGGKLGGGGKLKLRRDGKTLAKGTCSAHRTLSVIVDSNLTFTLTPASVGAAIASQSGALLLSTGDTVAVSLGDAPGAPPSAPGGDFRLSLALPEVFASVRAGHRIFFDDGKFEGVVLEAGPTSFRLRLGRVSGGTAKLAGEKGINLPDSPLSLPAMDAEDHTDLAAALSLKPDLIALSFVQTPTDVEQLHSALAAAGADAVGVLLKIETAAAFAALPSLLLAAMRRPRFGVMVARGDLAVEVGFARLSEVQEEMLWLCEAAHAPIMWATQVLDTMARTGAPSRSEVTDAAMAGRAEAVMLNKGSFMADVLVLLSDVLRRQTTHESKKMHMLRMLSVADTAAQN
jgi:pyruvate kinase